MPQRPDGVSIIALWHCVVAGGAVMSSCALAVPLGVMTAVARSSGPARLFGPALVGMGLTVGLLIGAAFAVVGWGLWNLEGWGRIGAIPLAALQLVWFPVGTAAGAFTLWYLLAHPEAQRAFGVETGTSD